MTEINSLRVALLEEDPTMRHRLLTALAQDPTLSVDWTGESALAYCAWLRACAPTDAPEVLLVDLGLPDGSGTAVIEACRRLHPACDLIGVTLFADDTSLLEAFAVGASGYLLKDGSELELLRHVRDLRSGGSPMGPIIARRLLQHWQRNDLPRAAPAAERPADLPAATRAGAAEHLTAKESEVLGLIARGFTYDEAAKRMSLSTHTVRTHVRNIYAKLDVHNKAEALFEARALGWLK